MTPNGLSSRTGSFGDLPVQLGRAILKNAQERKQTNPEQPSLFHENIRGSGYYH